MIIFINDIRPNPNPFLPFCQLFNVVYVEFEACQLWVHFLNFALHQASAWQEGLEWSAIFPSTARRQLVVAKAAGQQQHMSWTDGRAKMC